MRKKQSMLKRLDNPYFFISIALVIVVIAFVFSSPRISSAFFLFKRESAFNSFLKETKSNNQIDPRKFWEFRDLYSPGYIKFSNTGIDKSDISSTLNKLALDPQNVNLYFSKFDSRNLESLDGLTIESKIDKVIKNENLNIKSVLFKNSNTIIFNDAGNQTYIIFILPVSEMKKANGFFDYGEDQKILNGKNWIDITKLNN
jgi:hypothetical protein